MVFWVHFGRTVHWLPLVSGIKLKLTNADVYGIERNSSLLNAVSFRKEKKIFQLKLPMQNPPIERQRKDRERQEELEKQRVERERLERERLERERVERERKEALERQRIEKEQRERDEIKLRQE